MSPESSRSYLSSGQVPDWSLIPGHMREGVDMYITTGLVTGGFLTAFLENNLKETFARADYVNTLAIVNYLSFFTMYAPSQCWGSAERVRDWRDIGGLRGFLAKQQTDGT